MGKKSGRSASNFLSESKLPSISLRDKQSVRTTFRLKRETYETISWLANYNGVTKKELIDHAVVTLSELEGAYKALLEKSDEIFAEKDDGSAVFVRKTQVVTRKTLEILNKLSKELNISRDKLVERTIKVLKMINQNQVQKHEKALTKIEQLASQVEKTKDALKKLLEEEDPILARVYQVNAIVDRLYTAICSEISEGEPIDPYSF